jgi:FkbM family methyltransferase
VKKVEVAAGGVAESQMVEREKLSSKGLHYARYVQRFGFTAGSKNFLATLLSRRLAYLHDPTLNCDVVARIGTSDLPTFNQIFVSRDYEFDYRGLTPELIVDAGANVGYSTVYFARRFPGAMIVALEPESSNFEMLVQNTRDYRNVLPLKRALWRRECRLMIVNPTDEHWLFQVIEVESGEQGLIEGITIPTILQLAERKQVDLLKVDIEGSEREVFSGDCDVWLKDVPAIVIELHDWLRPGAASAFYRALSPYSFNQYQKGENILILKSTG